MGIVLEYTFQWEWEEKPTLPLAPVACLSSALLWKWASHLSSMLPRLLFCSTRYFQVLSESLAFQKTLNLVS